MKWETGKADATRQYHDVQAVGMPDNKEAQSRLRRATAPTGATPEMVNGCDGREANNWEVDVN